MPDRPVDQIEQVSSHAAHKDNLHAWGKLYVSRTGRTIGGWLVDSWSENGAPYWQAKMHWLDKTENKLFHVYMRIDWGRSSMSIGDEDTDIDPERAKFIRENVKKWEGEWLAAQG